MKISQQQAQLLITRRSKTKTDSDQFRRA